MDVKFIDKSKSDAIINSDSSTTRPIEKIGYTNILRRLPSDENSEQIYERKNEVSKQIKIDIII
jgi:hypothetical protein